MYLAHGRGHTPFRLAIFVCALTSSSLSLSTETPNRQPPAYSEDRAPCSNFQINKQPLFGDLHIHTQLSFDAYISSQRNRPADAYRYAKGEAITLPDAAGEQTIISQLRRPLDFAAVTDHAEFLGQINVCTEDSSQAGYWWPHCVMTRSSNLWVQLIAANWWSRLGGQLEDSTEKSFACQLSDCTAGNSAFWEETQKAAEDHYDRSSDCAFTTLVGYEYTDAPQQNNMHRNVIFRNANVTQMPISTYDTGRGNFPKLWRLLREQCLDTGKGCDVMSIPHNPNLAGGLMFRDPLNPEELQDRLAFESVVEITQHKGSSECRFDRLRGLGLGTEDELCDFEQVVADNLTMLGSVHGIVRTSRADAVALEDFGSRNMLRNTLKDGLALAQKTGTNPFVMGFIGSTDTHNATAGATDEDSYVGHIGRRDAQYRNVQDHFFSNPGGHAVVWATENSRDAIFDAIRRKETYATSGSRPIVRFFAGQVSPASCNDPEMIAAAYANGVPMGGNLYQQFDAQNQPMKPSFLLSAQKDPGSSGYPGLDLQRLQIVKGWVDKFGETHERVFDVAGDPNNGATVDAADCSPAGQGYSQLCTVWQDPDFDAQQHAFYYARVLENPSCRWSTRQCQNAGVNPFASACRTQAAVATQSAITLLGAEGDVYGKCCIDPAAEPFYSPVIQERAWTSPIWYQPSARN
jgi:hypothetical protein